MESFLNNQPFYVIEDNSYRRMMTTLLGGAKTVKSYPRHSCPSKTEKDCRCLSYDNYLDEDGIMVRKVEGVVKPVIMLSSLMRVLDKPVKKVE